MRMSPARGARALGSALLVVVLTTAAGMAQSTEVTTVAFAAEADAAGISLELAPGTGPTIAGAVSHAEITSDGPKAAGFGQGLANVPQTRAETEAPPGGQESASGGATNQDIGGLLVLDLAGGTAESESRLSADLPVSESRAGLGVASIAADPAANPLGAGFEIGVGAFDSTASAEASDVTDITAASTASGIVVGITVDVDVLGAIGGLQDQVCDSVSQVPGIGAELEAACDDLFGTATGQQPFAELTIGESLAACGWDGQRPDATGQAATVRLEVLGQDPIEVAPGETVTIAEGTPLEIGAGAGSFEKEAENGDPGDEDSVSARAAGAFLSLFAGQVLVALGDSTCGLSGQVTTEEVIARTGGEVLPVLLGGSALAAAGYGLRRFLRPRR